MVVVVWITNVHAETKRNSLHIKQMLWMRNFGKATAFAWLYLVVCFFGSVGLGEGKTVGCVKSYSSCETRSTILYAI